MKVLAFFAHPDDETMLAGGTMALLARAGAEMHYLMATRGEGGEMGEPPLCTREELGSVRERETECAVRALGGSSLSFLDYVDPLVGENDTLFAYAEDAAVIATQVADVVRRIDADVLISHGSNGEYGHPAHLLTHQAARMAVEMLQEENGKPLFYTVSACFPEHPKPRLGNVDDPADLVIDVTPAMEEKLAAALCHRTQNALFVRRASEKAGRKLTVPEVLVTLESLHRVTPLKDGTDVDPLLNLLEAWEWKKASA